MKKNNLAPAAEPAASIDFDTSLLEINLGKSVEQRITAHDAALEVAREFQKAGLEFRARTKAAQKTQSAEKDASR